MSSKSREYINSLSAGPAYKRDPNFHYGDVIMGAIASQITSLTIVYSTVYSDVDQRKHQSSASPAFVREINQWPVNSPHKWPVTRKKFPFDDVIMVITVPVDPLALNSPGPSAGTALNEQLDMLDSKIPWSSNTPDHVFLLYDVIEIGRRDHEQSPGTSTCSIRSRGRSKHSNRQIFVGTEMATTC